MNFSRIHRSAITKMVFPPFLPTTKPPPSTARSHDFPTKPRQQPIPKATGWVVRPWPIDRRGSIPTCTPPALPVCPSCPTSHSEPDASGSVLRPGWSGPCFDACGAWCPYNDCV